LEIIIKDTKVILKNLGRELLKSLKNASFYKSKGYSKEKKVCGAKKGFLLGWLGGNPSRRVA